MMDRHSNQDQRGVITAIESKSCWHKINSRNHEKELLWQWNSQGYHIRELAFLEVANCKLHSSGDSNSSFRLTWAPSYRSLSYTQCSLWVITGSKEFVGTQLPSWEKDTMKETWVIQYRNSRLWARQIRETLSPSAFFAKDFLTPCGRRDIWACTLKGSAASSGHEPFVFFHLHGTYAKLIAALGPVIIREELLLQF